MNLGLAFLRHRIRLADVWTACLKGWIRGSFREAENRYSHGLTVAGLAGETA